MDALEEVVVGGGDDDDHHHLSHHIVKGKRTKRSFPRLNSPLSFTMIAAAASASATDTPPPPPHSSGEEEEGPTAEDEDVALTLMLLARGDEAPIRAHVDHALRDGAWNNNNNVNVNINFNNNNNNNNSKFCSKKYVETTAGATAGGGAGVKVGMYVYECKTCGRTFPTFQALGGHRTSHTKEKAAAAALPLTVVDSGKRPFPAAFSLYDDDDVLPKAAKISPVSSFHYYYDSNTNNNSTKSSPRIHECSYCGAEFTSGQALGGHMRRHRGAAATAAAQVSPASSSFDKRVLHQKDNDNNNGKGLNLDLNLPPAGEENQDHRRRGQGPPENQEPAQIEAALFLSTTPPLVGCKYI